jgi:hypothetical protein
MNLSCISVKSGIEINRKKTISSVLSVHSVISFMSLVLVQVMFLFIFLNTDCIGDGMENHFQNPVNYPDKPPEFSGYLRLQAQAGFPQSDDFRNKYLNKSSLFDKAGDFRFLAEWHPSDSMKAEIHYEADVSGGDTRKITKFLDDNFPGYSDYFAQDLPSDRSQVLNLTHILKDENDLAMYHRLDRLNMTYSADDLSLGIGRQAITWGNGMIFNPVDMFNPFSPTALIRDYKTGNDMITVNYTSSEMSNIQLLWIPRRNTETGDVSQNESSLASRLQLRLLIIDMDIVVAKHRGDSVMAAGGVAYIGESALRGDIVINLAESGNERDGFVSAVLNIDRSWVWFDRNFYGLLEFYSNGAGTNDYLNVINDSWLISRVKNGEMYLFGRSYLAGTLRIELHPLVNVSMTGIMNTYDRSCLFQPQLVMDASSAIRINIAADLPEGRSDSCASPPLRIYSWITCWF